MAGFLEGKVVAVTGGGGGIGRAVALAAASAGARVLVADYGVSMAGEDPSSEVAEAVAAEIRGAGGEALAVADDISKMESGERLVATARRELRPPRRGGGRGRDPARAHALQHERGRMGRGRRHAPEGAFHRVPRRGGGDAQAGERCAGRFHLWRLRRERRPGELRRGQGWDREPGAVGRGRTAPLRRHRQCDRAGRPYPHVGQRPDRTVRDGRARGRGAPWSSSC